MGYASYLVSGGLHDGEECGYAVDTTCDAEGCAKEIDRGLGYLCGESPGGGEDSCGGYFCGDHLAYPEDVQSQRCLTCTHAIEHPVLELNEKGQCPACLIKPLPYKRDRHYFCHRCDRAYSMDTGEQIDNWAWRGGERTKLGGHSATNAEPGEG